MTAESMNQDDEPEIIKKKVLGCFKGIRLLQTVIILICFGVLVQQISTCISKLIYIPVTTYTHFDFNKTIQYPSVTFCKEPAYKFEKMLDYNLYLHPQYTSVWIGYNYSIGLDHLWEDITYNDSEMFVQYGLDSSKDNVQLIPTTGFTYGRCYTMVPKILATKASKTTGFSVTLKHNADDVQTAANGVIPPGFHIYVHYTREPFTEVEVYNGGLVQYLYISVGETMDVKLTVDEYLKISTEDDSCTHKEDYSANDCTAQCVWDIVGEEVGCSGPWMNSSLPRCSNYTAMRDLIVSYTNTYQSHECSSCVRFCKSYMYNTFVTDRKTMYSWDHNDNQWRFNSIEAALQSQIYIFFNSMMVSVYEERYNYDWNLFLSDLGGSVGFLLGLSVISLLKISGKMWQLIRPFLKSGKCKRASISGSTATVNVATVRYPDMKDKMVTNLNTHSNGRIHET